MKKINVGVIGVGAMGYNHAIAFHATKTFSIKETDVLINLIG